MNKIKQTLNQQSTDKKFNYTCQIITLKTVNDGKVVCRIAAQLLNVSCTLRLISKLHFFLLSIQMTTIYSLRLMIIIILHQHNKTERLQDNNRNFFIAYQTRSYAT